MNIKSRINKYFYILFCPSLVKEKKYKKQALTKLKQFHIIPFIPGMYISVFSITASSKQTQLKFSNL